MANFKVSETITGKAEGLYANNPADTGGETYAGISRKNWPNWKGWPIIDSIKATKGTKPAVINQYASSSAPLSELVSTFYKQNFWDVNSIDKIESQEIANEMYDTGVNMGRGVAARFLQRALNIANKNGALFPDLEIDGDIGPTTLKALAKADANLIFKILNVLQGARYIEICEKNRSQEQFVRSWFSRVTVIK